MEFPQPISGLFESFVAGKIPGQYSPDCNNIRPRDVLENLIRLGQRPGLDKAYSQQIGGESAPIVWVGTVTTVD